MTRFPEAGKAKTRLIPHYGADGACELHKMMTEFTLKEALKCNAFVNIYYTGANHDSMLNWLNNSHNNDNDNHKENKLEFIPQVQGNLGDKMYAALCNALDNKPSPNLNTKQKIIIIGSDCPNNREKNLNQALELLNTHDCVIGPSMDGGYYLIAFAVNLQNTDFLSTQVKPLFSDIDWGSSAVFEQTMAKVRQTKLKYTLLPMLSDVDEPQDVPAKISVIIPCLNEEANLNKLFTSMPTAFNVEIIISDAESTDNTKKIANTHDAIYINADKGRAKQILAASQKASGEILLFLHADSKLPPLWDVHIREALNNPKHSLGFFRFGIMEHFWTKGIIEWATNNIRCKYFNLPFGDQGLFVRKSNFDNWNLPAVPILEDVYLVKKAKKHGSLIALPQVLYTSGRRWLKYGAIRTTFMNWCVLFCAKLGMDLDTISKAYKAGQNPLWLLIKNRIVKAKP